MNKKIVLGIIIVLLAWSFFAIGFRDKAKPAYLEHDGMIFGTTYHITYESPKGKPLDSVINLAMNRVDSSLSIFKPYSTISRVNINDSSVVLDSLFLKVYKEGMEVSKVTDGAFDMTVAPLVNLWGFGFEKRANVPQAEVDSIMPFIGYTKIHLVGGHIVKDDPRMMLDASAIAKGFGCDQVALALQNAGVKNYLVEIGGEVALNGVNDKKEAWRIGINKPVDDSTSTVSEIEDVVLLENGGMATSGNYRNFYMKGGKKYAHEIDPKTGYPVQHSLLSATIIAPNCMTADAYATACMIMGVEKSMEICKKNPDLKGYFIYDDNGVNKEIWTDDFPVKKKN